MTTGKLGKLNLKHDLDTDNSGQVLTLRYPVGVSVGVCFWSDIIIFNTGTSKCARTLNLDSPEQVDHTNAARGLAPSSGDSCELRRESQTWNGILTRPRELGGS